MILHIENSKIMFWSLNGRNKTWFGKNCKKARKKYHTAKTDNAKDKNTCNRNQLNAASKEYKKSMNYYINKHKYESVKPKQLREMKTNNSKDFRKILKQNKKTSKIPQQSLACKIFFSILRT